MSFELKYAVKEYNRGRFVCAGGPLSLDSARKVATSKAAMLNLRPVDNMTWKDRNHIVRIVDCQEYI